MPIPIWHECLGDRKNGFSLAQSFWGTKEEQPGWATCLQGGLAPWSLEPFPPAQEGSQTPWLINGSPSILSPSADTSMAPTADADSLPFVWVGGVEGKVCWSVGEILYPCNYFWVDLVQAACSVAGGNFLPLMEPQPSSLHSGEAGRYPGWFSYTRALSKQLTFTFKAHLIPSPVYDL